jgi:uncharacterized Zn-binding protein involved in type VI secretion
MDNTAILGTMSSHGGTMITASSATFLTSGGAVALLGDSHSCPIPYHGITPIISGCATKATVGGVPVAILGATAGCGAMLISNFASNVELT